MPAFALLPSAPQWARCQNGVRQDRGGAARASGASSAAAAGSCTACWSVRQALKELTLSLYSCAPQLSTYSATCKGWGQG